MFYLETPRLLLVQTPLHILQMRLAQESFTADLALLHGTMTATFPPEWPGDALVLFPMLIEQYAHAPELIPWGGTLILRDEPTAIGQVGCKSMPVDGTVEIGYGLHPGYHRRGFATEIVGALVEWCLHQHTVERVTAECRIDNLGSIGVLENTGFAHIDRRYDVEEGELLVWERRA